MSNSLPLEIASYFTGKKIVVAGGAGFIGSHLSQTLLELGAEVTIIDNFITGSRHNIEHLQCFVIEADVSKAAESYFPAEYVPDAIFHFASPASPPKYQAHPVETYQVNSVATHNLLQFLKAKNPSGRFLFASTSEVYGDPAEHPQKESYWGNVNPNGVRSCYDESKRLGETICGVHARDLGMDVRIVRIFNTYGPRIDLEDGRVVPDFIKNALANKPFQIFGDGSQTRSYCYVTDLVEGILSLMGKAGLAGETVNLGNPRELTVLQTAEIVHNAVHSDVPFNKEKDIVFEPLPSDDPRRRCPDISKAMSLLSWQPKVSFEDGIRQTVEFFRGARV